MVAWLYDGVAGLAGVSAGVVPELFFSPLQPGPTNRNNTNKQRDGKFIRLRRF
jgi:hypothetical protein